MQKVWNDIESWLAENFPTGLKNLGAPALAEDIQSIEDCVGTRTPKELNDLLSIHNGEQPEEIWLLGDWSLLPVEYIRKSWDTEMKMSQEQDCALEPDQHVKPALWNPKWFPFAYDGSGGYLCVDMDPTPDGTVGQVIQTSSDGFARRVSVSVAALFEKFVDALNAEKLQVVDDCLEPEEDWWS